MSPVGLVIHYLLPDTIIDCMLHDFIIEMTLFYPQLAL